MAEQRDRGRAAARQATSEAGHAGAREILEAFGPTVFLGYTETAAAARVLGIETRDEADGFANVDGERPPAGAELADVFLDRTPFYAESGGQVGDTGTIVGSTGTFRVLDTTSADGITRHTGYVSTGVLAAGAEVAASRSTSSAGSRSGAITRRRTCSTGRCAPCSANT